MKLLLISLSLAGFGYAKSIQEDPFKIDHLKSDPLKSETILGNQKDKPQNGRNLVAVNEQSQEKSSSRFFGPSGYGLYPGFGGPAQFPGGPGGYPGGTSGYPSGLGGYPGGFGGYLGYGGFGGYPGGYGYPGAGAFAGQSGGYGHPGAGAFVGHSGYGYGLQQQQQLQGGGYTSGAFAG